MLQFSCFIQSPESIYYSDHDFGVNIQTMMTGKNTIGGQCRDPTAATAAAVDQDQVIFVRIFKSFSLTHLSPGGKPFLSEHKLLVSKSRAGVLGKVLDGMKATVFYGSILPAPIPTSDYVM